MHFCEIILYLFEPKPYGLNLLVHLFIVISGFNVAPEKYFHLCMFLISSLLVLTKRTLYVWKI